VSVDAKVVDAASIRRMAQDALDLALAALASPRGGAA
jgi:hypothetical protein